MSSQPTKEPMKKLGRQITEALTAETISTSELGKLLMQVERAIENTTEAVEAERKRSLDPTNADPAKSRALVQDMEFEYERLQKALPELQQRMQKAKRAEHAAEWNKQYKEVEKKRDKLAEELTETYPPFVTKMLDLLSRIRQVDPQRQGPLVGSRAVQMGLHALRQGGR